MAGRGFKLNRLSHHEPPSAPRWHVLIFLLYTETTGKSTAKDPLNFWLKIYLPSAFP
jgi:hypothetical protein